MFFSQQFIKIFLITFYNYKDALWKDKMKNIKCLLGKRIREIRKNCNLTQEQLAERIGIEIPSLSNIETGKNYPNPETIEKIAKGLRVRIFELYIFEHLVEPDEDRMLREINSALKANSRLLKVIYRIVSNIKEKY